MCCRRICPRQKELGRRGCRCWRRTSVDFGRTVAADIAPVDDAPTSDFAVGNAVDSGAESGVIAPTGRKVRMMLMSCISNAVAGWGCNAALVVSGKAVDAEVGSPPVVDAVVAAPAVPVCSISF